MSLACCVLPSSLLLAAAELIVLSGEGRTEGQVMRAVLPLPAVLCEVSLACCAFVSAGGRLVVSWLAVSLGGVLSLGGVMSAALARTEVITKVLIVNQNMSCAS